MVLLKIKFVVENRQRSGCRLSEILSQSEIDELLSALMTGDEEFVTDSLAGTSGMKIKDYDFRTANRFPKEQIRTFSVVFETYSQLLSNNLSSILRVSCECEILSIEEVIYSEFDNSLPTPVILAVTGAPPMYGSLLVQMSPEFAYMLISRMFGGVTTGENTKQFTEIELALVERILRQQCVVFDEAWGKVIELSMQIDRIETSPQFAQITAPNEPVVVVIINVTMGEESGLMSICIPHTAIEPVAQQMDTSVWISSGVHAPMPLTAYFKSTPATIDDIISLQVGDVIKLNHTVDEPLTINVQDIPKFRASAGTYDNKYAMQIVEVLGGE